MEKKNIFKQIISGLILGTELPARFRVIAFLPEETLLWFICDKYDTALLAMRWDSHFLYHRVIRTLMYFPQKHENISLWCFYKGKILSELLWELLSKTCRKLQFTCFRL